MENTTRRPGLKTCTAEVLEGLMVYGGSKVNFTALEIYAHSS